MLYSIKRLSKKPKGRDYEHKSTTMDIARDHADGTGGSAGSMRRARWWRQRDADLDRRTLRPDRATADVGKPYAAGEQAYIDWKNAQGGVDGHQLVLVHNDYAYQVPKAEELFSQYVTQDKVIAVAG